MTDILTKTERPRPLFRPIRAISATEAELLVGMAREIAPAQPVARRVEPVESRKPTKWERRKLRQGIQHSLERSGSPLSIKDRAKRMAFRVVQEGSR